VVREWAEKTHPALTRNALPTIIPFEQGQPLSHFFEQVAGEAIAKTEPGGATILEINGPDGRADPLEKRGNGPDHPDRPAAKKSFLQRKPRTQIGRPLPGAARRRDCRAHEGLGREHRRRVAMPPPPEGVPHTLILHTAMALFGTVTKVHDPFSKRFEDSLQRGMERLAADHAASPWLLGVFVDNEVNWTGGTKLVREIMKSPQDTPARPALVEFLSEHYGDIAALNKAWDTAFAGFAEIAPLPGPGGGTAFERDLGSFLEVFAAKYFGLCRRATEKISASAS